MAEIVSDNMSASAVLKGSKEEWENTYFFIEHFGRTKCLICKVLYVFFCIQIIQYKAHNARNNSTCFQKLRGVIARLRAWLRVLI